MASSQGSFYAIPVRADANKTVQFVFEEPTVRGFGFVLGDVDAENVFYAPIPFSQNQAHK